LAGRNPGDRLPQLGGPPGAGWKAGQSHAHRDALVGWGGVFVWL